MYFVLVGDFKFTVILYLPLNREKDKIEFTLPDKSKQADVGGHGPDLNLLLLK